MAKDIRHKDDVLGNGAITRRRLRKQFLDQTAQLCFFQRATFQEDLAKRQRFLIGEPFTLKPRQSVSVRAPVILDGGAHVRIMPVGQIVANILDVALDGFFANSIIFGKLPLVQ